MPLFPPIWFAGCLLVAIAPASLEFLQFTRPCAAMLAACSSNTFFSRRIIVLWQNTCFRGLFKGERYTPLHPTVLSCFDGMILLLMRDAFSVRCIPMLKELSNRPIHSEN